MDCGMQAACFTCVLKRSKQEGSVPGCVWIHVNVFLRDGHVHCNLQGRHHQLPVIKATPRQSMAANSSASALTVQGCMKSGQVLTDRRYKWFEPEYWRFGEAAGAEGQINYMRHASGQIYGLSGPVAKYIGRNGPILHRFANEDVTLGAWLVGLEITHVDERRMCCDSVEKCNAQVRALAVRAVMCLCSRVLGSCVLCLSKSLS